MRRLWPNFPKSNGLNLPLVAIIGTYFLLVTIYSLATPLLEAPDAYFHFAVIEHMARTGDRPSLDDPHNQPWRQMIYHAPLYYMSAAVLISPINTDDFFTHYPRNPHAQIGEPHAQDNHNFVAHAGDKWSKTGLAIRVVRLFSMVLGAITLLSVYALIRYAIPPKPKLALLGMLILLFNPQFLYMNAVVSNDVLVTSLTILGLALILRAIRLGTTWQRVLVIGLVLALNSIAKVSGIALYPIAALTLAWVTWRDHRSLKRILCFAAIGLATWALLAGWWYWDNFQQFGDPFAARLIAESTGLRLGHIDYRNEMRGLYFSFWGLFGWFNIIAPAMFYNWVTLFIIFSGIGSLIAFRRAKWTIPNGMILTLLGGHATIFLIGWQRFMTWVTAGQGRLWFPLLGGIALFLGIGLAELPRTAQTILLGGMAAATVAFPFLRIHPTFRPQDQLSIERWSPSPDAAVFSLREPWNPNSCLQLWVNNARVDPASRTVEMSVVSAATCQVEGYWSRFVHLSDLSLETCMAGDTHHILAQYDSMPDKGNLPLPAFKIGHVVEEQIRIEVPAMVDFDRISHLQLGLYDANGSFIRMIIEHAVPTDDIRITRCGAPDAVNIRLHQ